jgi:preprotein translocase subunit SecD
VARRLAILAGMWMAGPACGEPVLLKFVHDKDQLAFAAEDVSRTTMTLDSLNKPAIAVVLGDGATDAFRAFTAQRIGQQFQVFVCDVLVVTPVIQAPVEGGQLLLTGPVLEDDKVLRNKLMVRSCQ